MMKKLGSPRAGRTAFTVFSLVIILFGAGSLFRGHIGYRNWWGGVVFAPFAIIIGTLCLFIAGFRPKLFSNTSSKKKSRIRGWPTGRARYYRDR
jgi:hypothetical protein